MNYQTHSIQRILSVIIITVLAGCSKKDGDQFEPYDNAHHHPGDQSGH